jgi:hypothetical protein
MFSLATQVIEWIHEYKSWSNTFTTQHFDTPAKPQPSVSAFSGNEVADYILEEWRHQSTKLRINVITATQLFINAPCRDDVMDQQVPSSFDPHDQPKLN